MTGRGEKILSAVCFLAMRNPMKNRSFSFVLRLFVSAAFVCLFFCAPSQAQRLSANVVPSHYSLALAPDLKTATFTGEETIDIAVKEPTRAITLNAIEIEFQSVTVAAGGQEQTAAIALDKEKQQATFTFPAEVPAGEAALKIRFTGILNNELRGFYLSKTAARNYAVTQFESTDARRAFPCFDEPAFKATFDVSLTIDAADTAISNTQTVSDTAAQATGKHTLRFETTPKMSTYLLAFLVGDFECTAGEQDGVALRVCATPGKKALTPYALDVAKFVLHYYDDYFGIHFPLKKLDLIAIPDFEAGAMENFGAITYRETDLLLDPKTASIGAKEMVAIVVAHEMAHQWFGDLVTMQWWDNIWLNEGFASWMENKPVAALHPEWNVAQMVAAGEQETLDLDAQPTTRAIRAKAETPEEIDQMFDGISYGKASDVLLMVENYLGEETFRKGVHNYLAAHQYGNATAEDFWSALAQASGKPVDKIMESLVAQPGAPILVFGDPAKGKVSVAQNRFFLSSSISPDPKQKWTLPVCFKTGGGQQCQVLTPSTKSLEIPASALLFANAAGKSYYRAAYAPAQYAALAAQAETSLTPSERIALVGDEWAQVRANKATVGDYLNLVSALKNDADASVLSAALGNVGGIADRVASTKEERDALAGWIRRSFAPAYAKLGPPAATDSPNTRELRANLFSLLADRGNDAALQAQAREIANSYLADPAATDATLGQAALGVAASHGDTALFEQLEKIYETATTPELQVQALRLLVEFEDPALLNRALEYSISSKVRNQDSLVQLAIAMQIPENREAAWKFIQSHWSQVEAQSTTEMGGILVNSSGSFCTAEDRESVKSFFAAHPVSASGVALHHALERIDGCIELRRLQEPNLNSWLAAQPAN
jgi:aminopeptidase N/puromycin-sensitive aminopeptidase